MSNSLSSSVGFVFAVSERKKTYFFILLVTTISRFSVCSLSHSLCSTITFHLLTQCIIYVLRYQGNKPDSETGCLSKHSNQSGRENVILNTFQQIYLPALYFLQESLLLTTMSSALAICISLLDYTAGTMHRCNVLLEQALQLSHHITFTGEHAIFLIITCNLHSQTPSSTSTQFPCIHSHMQICLQSIL